MSTAYTRSSLNLRKRVRSFVVFSVLSVSCLGVFVPAMAGAQVCDGTSLVQVTEWDISSSPALHMIAVDSLGNVYLTHELTHQVLKFDPNGAPLAAWGSRCNLRDGTDCVDPDGGGPLEVGDGQFNGPRGVAVDSNDDVYVVDGQNARIQKFNSDGTFSAKWGSFCRLRNDSLGSCVDPDGVGPLELGDGQFFVPFGVAVDSLNNVYVTQNLDLDQTLPTVEPSGHYAVQKFDSSGAFLAKWGPGGTADGEFVFPWGISADPDDNIHVADYRPGFIQKFDSSGTFLTKWGNDGEGDARLELPTDIAIDSNGVVFVLSREQDAVIKLYDTAGGFLRTAGGGEGTGTGQFLVTEAIGVGSDGNVYVSDSVVGRVQKFACLESVCTPLPASGCRTLATAGKGGILVADKFVSKRDKLKWKWIAGEATTVGAFLDPVSGSADYALCLYDDGDGTPTLLRELRAFPGGTCDEEPCWRLAGPSGFKLKDKTGPDKGGYPDGISKMKLKAAREDRAKVLWKGKGGAVQPSPPPYTMPVLVQFIADDGGTAQCWETTYTTPTKNEPGKFKAVR